MLKTHAHSIVSLILVSVNRYIITAIKTLACRVIAFFLVIAFGPANNLLAFNSAVLTAFTFSVSFCSICVFWYVLYLCSVSQNCKEKPWKKDMFPE